MSSIGSCVARVAVVSQTEALASHIRQLLTDDTIVVEAITVDVTGSPGIVATERPDMIVMDRQSMATPLRQMRQFRHLQPAVAIFVANAASEAECGAFLQEGADDACIRDSVYFRTRLHAMVRRVRMLNAQMRIAIEDLVLDREYRRVWCRVDEVHLSPIEYDVLLCLFNHAPSVVSKEALLGLMSRQSHRGSDSNTLEVHISSLRKKLSGSRNVTIVTIRRVGYVLSVLSATLGVG